MELSKTISSLDLPLKLFAKDVGVFSIGVPYVVISIILVINPQAQICQMSLSIPFLSLWSF